jgi:hypothetical protein
MFGVFMRLDLIISSLHHLINGRFATMFGFEKVMLVGMMKKMTA